MKPLKKYGKPVTVRVGTEPPNPEWKAGLKKSFLRGKAKLAKKQIKQAMELQKP